MASSSHCYLPRFAAAVEGPKRPVSLKTKVAASHHAMLLTAWHESRLDSVLRATWALVLHYYLRTEDISFGYQHIDGDAVSRDPVQRSSHTNISTVRLAIDENDSIKAIVDKLWNHETTASQPDGGELSEDFGKNWPFNTILMLRTYRKANQTPPSPSQSILATAVPDQVRCFPHSRRCGEIKNVLSFRN